MRTPHFLPLMLAGFATTLYTLAPSELRAAAPVAPFEDIVRVGDRAMSCTALAAEINTLGQADAPPPRKKKGFGFLKVLSVAVPFVGATQAIGGALLQSGVGAAEAASAHDDTGAAMTEAQRTAREAMAGGSTTQQRKARLMTIFEAKAC